MRWPGTLELQKSPAPYDKRGVEESAGGMLVTTSSHAVPFERTIPRSRLTVLAADERIMEARSRS